MTGKITKIITCLKTIQWNCRRFGAPENVDDETGYRRNHKKSKAGIKKTIKPNSNTQQNVSLFAQFLKEVKVHVILLQSVELPLSCMPKFPGFTLTNYGKRFNCNLVSTAIYTDNRLRASTIKSPIPRTNGASSCGCKVELQNKKSFQFISAYFPHGSKDINLNFF